MAASNRSITLWLGPRQAGAPDDLRTATVDIIDAAGSTLLVATQQLEDRDVMRAILRARARGVTCRVALERDYLLERKAAADPFARSGMNEVNREMLLALFRSRVHVSIDRTSRLVHSNFLVVDPENDERAQVLLTSANLTPSCFDVNLNAACLLRNRELARAFAAEFDDICQDRFSPVTSPPPEAVLDGVPVRVVFGPRHQPEMELMKWLLKSREQIRFAMFTLSHTSGIDDTLASLADRRKIVGVIDKDQFRQAWAPKQFLREAGIGLRAGASDGKLHHKLIAIDDCALLTGTFNFTRAARFSHETMVVLGSARRDATPPAREFVAAAAAEIDRLFAAGRDGD